MISEVWLDESVDEEVFILDIQDGPLWAAIEGAFDLDPNEWSATWAFVKGSDWFDDLFGPDDLDTSPQLGFIDPRFTEDLLNAPVTQWKWS